MFWRGFFSQAAAKVVSSEEKRCGPGGLCSVPDPVRARLSGRRYRSSHGESSLTGTPGGKGRVAYSPGVAKSAYVKCCY